MAERLTAAQRRYVENALLIAALGLIFRRLKASYESKQLGDLAETTSGGTPLRNISSYFDGDIPWIKSGELNDGIISKADENITREGLDNSSAKVFPKGTLVVALYGATVGKTGILGIDAASNQAVCAIAPKSDVVTTEFLFWFLRYKRPDFLGSSIGGAQPNISQKILRVTEVPLPPKNYQEVICSFLKIVEKRQKGDKSLDYPNLPDELEDIRRIVSRIEALAGRVNEAQRLRRESLEEARSFIQATQREIFSKAEDWQTCILDEVAPINMGQSPPGDSYNLDREGVPLLNGPTEFGYKHPTPVQWTTRPTKFCKSGDILICVRGATTGKMNWADQNYCIGRGLAALSVDTNKCVPEYVYYFVQTQTQDLLGRTAGSTFPNLPGEKLRTLPIPVPPLNEQLRIVAYLDDLQKQVDKMRQLQSDTQKELDALLPSTLDKALKGEL